MSEHLRLTTGRWTNRHWLDDDSWDKALAHSGHYEDMFTYGQDHPSTWTTGQQRIHKNGRPYVDGPLQVALILCRAAGLFAIDVDKPEEFPDSNVAGYLSWSDAISIRGDHFHILIDARHLRDWFPRQGATIWGDLKAHGFVPLPGSVHYSGAQYKPGPGRIVEATRELIEAAMADRCGCSSGGGVGRTGRRNKNGPYDHDTYRASVVFNGILAGLDLDEIRAQWDAAPDHDPSCGAGGRGYRFKDADWKRHLGTAERTTRDILAREARQKAAQDNLMGFLRSRRG